MASEAGARNLLSWQRMKDGPVIRASKLKPDSFGVQGGAPFAWRHKKSGCTFDSGTSKSQSHCKTHPMDRLAGKPQEGSANTGNCRAFRSWCGYPVATWKLAQSEECLTVVEFGLSCQLQ